MAKLHRQQLYATFERSKANGQLKKAIDAQLNGQFLAAKQELIQQIQEHPVSKEIAAGPNNTDESRYINKGNLYSFIGFKTPRKPIAELIQAVDDNVKIKPAQFARGRGDKIQYFKQISFPRVNDIESHEISKYDEWNGGSWIAGVRNGIAGAANYLFKLVNNFKDASRSGPAIQVPFEVNKEGQHTPAPDYLEKEIGDFEAKARGVNLAGINLKIR